MATILLVEDELLLAECVAGWLRAAAHEVRHTPDAQTAIDAIDTTTPELIILDMLLPGANGVQFLHELRSHADLANIPVILWSNALPPQLPNMRGYGVVAVLDKTTLTRPRLVAAVQEALSAPAI